VTEELFEKFPDSCREGAMAFSEARVPDAEELLQKSLTISFNQLCPSSRYPIPAKAKFKAAYQFTVNQTLGEGDRPAAGRPALRPKSLEMTQASFLL
jgi:hypothetical protein